jgi:hypothetical protein
MEEMSRQLAALRDQVAASQAPDDRPRPRDVLLGAAVGLGLAGLLARRSARRTETAH